MRAPNRKAEEQAKRQEQTLRLAQKALLFSIDTVYKNALILNKMPVEKFGPQIIAQLAEAHVRTIFTGLRAAQFAYLPIDPATTERVEAIKVSISVQDKREEMKAKAREEEAQAVDEEMADPAFTGPLSDSKEVETTDPAIIPEVITEPKDPDRDPTWDPIDDESDAIVDEEFPE